MAAGRPKKPIDIETVKKLAAIHCTWEEIESIVGASRRTLERNYAQDIKDARNNGKMSIRRKQYEVAMQGNVVMLKWLGQQYLGQTDKAEIKPTDGNSLEIIKSLAASLALSQSVRKEVHSLVSERHSELVSEGQPTGSLSVHQSPTPPVS